MDGLTWLRQATLLVHAMAFAFALSAVMREDIALLRARRIDRQRLAATSRTLVRALLALWLTRLLLVAFQVGADLSAVAMNPKLVAKLLVVLALTANGFALHRLGLGRLQRSPAPADRRLQDRAALLTMLGASSSASWLAASFIGLSRVVAPALSLADYLLMYAAMLAVVMALGLLLLRRHVALLLQRG